MPRPIKSAKDGLLKGDYCGGYSNEDLFYLIMIFPLWESLYVNQIQ